MAMLHPSWWYDSAAALTNYPVDSDAGLGHTVKLVIVGTCLLSAGVLAAIALVEVLQRPPAALPVYFRRTVGQAKGKVEPLAEVIYSRPCHAYARPTDAATCSITESSGFRST
jgi:hypothetical protein